MRNNYDNIARYYDFLSRLVFRTAQQDAQTELLPYIKKNNTILIAGGGTGWILEKIAEKCPPGLTIYYIEISANMIKLAKQKKYQPNTVIFINQAIEDVAVEEVPKFDVMMTPFLFDNFTRERIAPIFTHLHRMLQPGGNWLFTDFHYQESAPFWQKLLLNTMYTFFRIICHVEAAALSDIEPLFSSNHYTLLHVSFYFKKFIRSAVYRKGPDVNVC